MDLGTIKTKLKSNSYDHLQEFIDDVLLVFDNCILYNGVSDENGNLQESSHVGTIALTIKEEFKKQYEFLNMDFYL
jgi:hypothetical protein